MKNTILSIIIAISTMSCFGLPGTYYNIDFDEYYGLNTYSKEYVLNANAIVDSFNRLHRGKYFYFNSDFGNLELTNVRLNNGLAYMQFTLNNINGMNDKFIFNISATLNYDGRYLYINSLNIENMIVSRFKDRYMLENALRSNLINLRVADMFLNFEDRPYAGKLDNVYIKGNKLIGTLKW